MYRVEYTDIAEKALLKLDQQVRRRIESYFRDRVMNSEEPKALAESLAGELRGLWRFRVGDYRIICDIQGARLLVLVLQIAHRKEAYR